MSCCATAGQTLMVEISISIPTKQRYVLHNALAYLYRLLNLQPPYTKIDLGHINLIRMKKLPRISGGEVSGKIEDLTAREEDLLIILIKHSNTADRYIIFEGKDNQVLSVVLKGCAIFIWNIILVGVAVSFNAAMSGGDWAAND